MRANATAKLIMQYKTIEIGNVEAGDIITKYGERIRVDGVKHHPETSKPYFETTLGYLIPFEDTVKIEQFECLVPTTEQTDITTFLTDALGFVKKEGTAKSLYNTRKVLYGGTLFVIRSTDTVPEVWKRYVEVKKQNSIDSAKEHYDSGYHFYDELEELEEDSA